MIKGLLHEPRKRDRTVPPDAVPDQGDELQRSWHRSSGMLDNGKFESIVKLKPLEVMERPNFPFDPGDRS